MHLDSTFTIKRSFTSFRVISSSIKNIRSKWRYLLIMRGSITLSSDESTPKHLISNMKHFKFWFLLLFKNKWSIAPLSLVFVMINKNYHLKPEGWFMLSERFLFFFISKNYITLTNTYKLINLRFKEEGIRSNSKFK